jgi:hypothetical protein
MLKTTCSVISMFVAIFVLSGCGVKGTTQFIHANNVDITAMLTPAPIAMMQDEGITIQFSQSGKTADVKNVSVEFAMPSMTMGDAVPLTEVSPGKFTGDYRFSMTGNWVEKIHFTNGNQLEIATLSFDINQ